MDKPSEKPERRHRERRLRDRLKSKLAISLGLLFLAGLSLAAYSFYFEPNRLVVRRQSFALENWPAGARPLRIAALADIHVGSPYIGMTKMEKIVKTCNALEPDVVVLLGDYVILGVLGGHFVEPEDIGPKLAGLKARHGVYAVLGNHDWWYDGFRIQRALEAAGIKVLEDEAVALDHEGRRVWLVGVADKWTRRPNIERALAPVPEGEPAVVITHNPDVFPLLPPKAGLTLAGHTHGGQVKLPLMGRPIVPSRYRERYAAGAVRRGSQHMYVSSGIGTSVLPVRFRVPPEIAFISAGGSVE
ncbi:MAG: metallophosphoesterase [Elusimicrobiota bacterium]